jgi:hypothetical protein
MRLFEVRDVVKENCGRDKLSEPQLEWCLARGLREIEKRDNFYWMEAKQTFDIMEDVQTYSITDDLLIPDFKEAVILFGSDRTADDPGWFEISGPDMLQDTKVNFTEGDTGQPGFWTLQEDNDNPSIVLWQVPDQDYRGELHYYRWTELPASSTSSAHEVLKHWPEALIYLACEHAVMVSTKDPEQAMYWRSLFVNMDPKVNTEYKRIKDYQRERKTRKRFNSSPSNGLTTLTNRSNSQAKVWF